MSSAKRKHTTRNSTSPNKKSKLEEQKNELPPTKVIVDDASTLTLDDSPQKVIVQLCKLYYKQGWVSGTGGGFSISKDGKVYIAPSGVHKERLTEDQIYILDSDGKVVYDPNEKLNTKFKISACKPLFYNAYNIRGAGAVIHSHSMNAMLATLIFKDEFKVTHLEMIKGIRGHGYYDELVVPIIENTAYEHELTDRMAEVIKKYPKTFAVLVRRHGVYVWGKDWVECKTHAEVYDFLFEAAVRMKQLGFDASKKPDE